MPARDHRSSQARLPDVQTQYRRHASRSLCPPSRESVGQAWAAYLFRFLQGYNELRVGKIGQSTRLRIALRSFGRDGFCLRELQVQIGTLAQRFQTNPFFGQPSRERAPGQRNAPGTEVKTLFRIPAAIVVSCAEKQYLFCCHAPIVRHQPPLSTEAVVVRFAGPTILYVPQKKRRSDAIVASRSLSAGLQCRTESPRRMGPCVRRDDTFEGRS